MSPELEVTSEWNPIEAREIASILRGVDFFWCLAGGLAVERFVGERYRSHGDTDIVVLRPDQLALQRALSGWKLFAADPPGPLRRWKPGEFLAQGIHDIWAHRVSSRRWELQVMLVESDGVSWHFRRDDRASGSVADLASVIDEIPCIRVELQLLYKSKEPRAKDQLDFCRALPKLDDDQRATLASWLAITNPQGHEWSGALAP